MCDFTEGCSRHLRPREAVLATMQQHHYHCEPSGTRELLHRNHTSGEWVVTNTAIQTGEAGPAMKYYLHQRTDALGRGHSVGFVRKLAHGTLFPKAQALTGLALLASAYSTVCKNV